LKGEEIPLAGRIVTVADVFDALTHARRYKQAWSIEQAREQIATLAGTQFDPEVAEAFLQLLDREGERLVSGAHEQKFQSELLPRATADRSHVDLYGRAMAWQRET
ncbi:MAG: HD domain-containing phosphohydrolase, partial [Nitrospirota bacterium]|nr:HD domain-containing phosphohydrolase [Nitrospirota bacterium]